MSEVKKSDWDVPSNPVLVYADSYRDSARRGQKLADIWSVISDLERNIAPLWTAQRLRADTAEAELVDLRSEVERLQRAEKNDLIAYKAVIEKQNEIRAERDDLQKRWNSTNSALQRRDLLNERMQDRIEERDAMLRSALPAVKYESKRGDDAGQQYRLLVEKIDAALNPNPEAESQ